MNKLMVVVLGLALCTMAAPAMAQVTLADGVDAGIINGGRLVVGNIGSVSPGRTLDIRPNTNNTFAFSVKNATNTSEVVQFQVSSGGGGLVNVRNETNTTTVRLSGISGAKSFINNGNNFGIGTTNPSSLLHVNGTAKVKILEITGGADLSEQFDVAEKNAEPGTVVAIDPSNPGALMVSSKAYDRTVAGVISGAGGLKTGMIMGQVGSEADGEHAVALTGRVYVKADASNGAIQPGDLMTTSHMAGHAMKVTDFAQAQGAIIGKAMTALDNETGLVLVLVSLQ